MKSLTHRERVLKALSHERTDRVPIDFGGTRSSTIILPAYENLKKFLKLEHETKLIGKRQRTVYPDPRILEMFDVDIRPLMLGELKSKAPNELDENTMVDAWGTIWKKAPGGHFINAKGALEDADPDPGVLEQFPWPDPNDPNLYQGLRERAVSARQNGDFAVVLNLALGIMHQCWFMRGFEQWLLDLYQNKTFASHLLDITTDLWCNITKEALKIAGDNIDVCCFGDDMAMQEGLFINPSVYRELIKPGHKRMVDAIKAQSGAKVLLHTCGSVFSIMEDLIDIGVDAINPVQVRARDMDPAKLKQAFGTRVSFWGGIDTQRTLPFGTSQEVRHEVRKMVDCLGAGGGYVLASVHNIQAEVPPENVVAMLDEAMSYRPPA
jgi:uroporphyrinogen decarboxylase